MHVMYKVNSVKNNTLQDWIQVECLTVLVVAFIVMVDWLCCGAKLHMLLDGSNNFLSGKKTYRMLSISCLAMSVIFPRNTINSTGTMNATTETIKHSTWIHCRLIHVSLASKTWWQTFLLSNKLHLVKKDHHNYPLPHKRLLPGNASVACPSLI